MKAKSSLANKLLRRYLLITLLLLVVIVVIPLALKFLLGMRTWYYDDPFYPLLRFANDHILILVIVGALLIWLLTTWFFIRQAAGYLNETLGVAKQLVSNPEKPITLSSDLRDFANEMNQIRMDTLFHQRAAKEAEQKKNDLIVYLAHDLRTPLTSIIGYLTLLEESPDLPPAMRAKYTGITLEKAYRLESLINEFFEITRFNLATVSLVTKAVDLSVMLEQISYEFLPMLTPKNLSWEMQIEEAIWVDVDTEKFERVLDNLIKNAILYATPGTALRLTLARKQNQGILTLGNQGATLPADKLERIFEPFFRGDSARGTQSGGTGLGLPIAKEIVESHHGTLKAESVADYFQMVLTLPISKTYQNPSSAPQKASEI